MIILPMKFTANVPNGRVWTKCLLTKPLIKSLRVAPMAPPLATAMMVVILVIYNLLHICSERIKPLFIITIDCETR